MGVPYPMRLPRAAPALLLVPALAAGLWTVQRLGAGIVDAAQGVNVAGAQVVADVFSEGIERNLAFAEYVGAGLVRGGLIQRRDVSAVQARLADAVAPYPGIDRALVLDPSGRVWAEYPIAREVRGADLSESEWFKEAVRTRRPVISGTHRELIAPRGMVVAAVVPLTEGDRLLGYLVAHSRLERFRAWLAAVRLGGTGGGAIIDPAGALAVHPGAGMRVEHEEYASLAQVRDALRGVSPPPFEFKDPLTRRQAYAAVHPFRLGDRWWAAMSEQPVSDVRAPLRSIELGLALLALLVLAALALADRRGARLEGETRRLRADAERWAGELQRYSDVVAHDLQEPVRVSALMAQLLAKRFEGDPGARGVVERMVSAAEKSQTLLNDFLAHARIRELPRDSEPTPAADALESARRGLALELKAAGAVVRSGPLPSVRVGQRELVQLFYELLSNALKFKGTAPLVVEVSAERRGRVWRFRFADNGSGFDQRHSGRLFQLFENLRAQGSGTGAGLAVVKRIVERHGGRVWAESAPGQGATFLFELPD